MSVLEIICRSAAVLGSAAVLAVCIYNAPMILFIGWFFGLPVLLAGAGVAAGSAIFAYAMAKPLWSWAIERI